ncbi:unnamed protein product [Scytosiphon promiscuus]
MLRLGLSVRRCRNFKIHSSCGRCSSFSSGPEHDDYWAAAKTEAQTTPAYQQATAAAAGANPPPAAGGDLWATPGNYTASRMPMGDAYGPSSSSAVPEDRSMRPSPGMSTSNAQFNRDPPPPAFDMESSMHLSPFKQVDVRPFMGQTLVDIRQYYQSPGGASLPLKKGISLTVAQWRRLQAAMGEIDAKVQAMEQQRGMHQNGEEGPGGRAP